MNQKAQYCNNVIYLQIDLKIECDPNKNSTIILMRANDSKMCIKNLSAKNV